MARYDYKCPSCGTRFEVEHPMSTHPSVSCPKCGSKAQKVFSSSGIVFSGSGFYNTDQRGKK
ncbi:FmdB family zinc ribbon protein [Olsenella phocaeensis]|uniref:FmdB family zinc ribbon protein n=1 Tax=Olsenella phocaeensis TaxID=1852385 RepID=UPI003A95D4D6